MLRGDQVDFVMKCLFAAILMTFASACGFAYAQFGDGPFEEEPKRLEDVQMWVGKNGKGFRGVFLRREGDVLVIMKDGSDKIYRVKIENLSEKTKAWFVDASNARQEAKRVGEGGLPQSKIPEVKGVKLVPGKVIDLDRALRVDSSGYRLVDEKGVDRSIIPNFNQADYGSKSSDCVPNSYAMFVAWWHVRKWVNVPQKDRNFGDKVDWIHKRLARCLKTRNNSGTSVRDNPEELTKFFKEEVKSDAAFTFQAVMDYRPENLEKFTKGANGTILLLSTYNGSRYQGGHAVALKSISKDGVVKFNTWGLDLKGKLKVIPKSEKEIRKWIWTEEGRHKRVRVKIPSYEIELMNRVDLPEWFVNDEVRFTLEVEKRDQLVVLTPYLPVKKGEKVDGK